VHFVVDKWSKLLYNIITIGKETIMAKSKGGGARVTNPKNRGTGVCDMHITDAKGNTRKYKTPSIEVMEMRTSSNGAPRKNFCFGRDRYTLQGK
jgi:hypothetical protein